MPVLLHWWQTEKKLKQVGNVERNERTNHQFFKSVSPQARQ